MITNGLLFNINIPKPRLSVVVTTQNVKEFSGPLRDRMTALSEPAYT